MCHHACTTACKHPYKHEESVFLYKKQCDPTHITFGQKSLEICVSDLKYNRHLPGQGGAYCSLRSQAQGMLLFTYVLSSITPPALWLACLLARWLSYFCFLVFLAAFVFCFAHGWFCFIMVCVAFVRSFAHALTRSLVFCLLCACFLVCVLPCFGLPSLAQRAA